MASPLWITNNILASTAHQLPGYLSSKQMKPYLTWMSTSQNGSLPIGQALPTSKTIIHQVITRDLMFPRFSLLGPTRSSHLSSRLSNSALPNPASSSFGGKVDEATSVSLSSLATRCESNSLILRPTKYDHESVLHAAILDVSAKLVPDFFKSSGMAEKGDTDDLNPEDTGFKPPPPKSLAEICDADKDDPALVEYKKKLLGDIPPPVYPSNPKNVIVQKLQIEFPDEKRPPAEIQLLDADLTILKKSPIIIKEGVTYRVSVFFFVQREIVAGLRYIQATYKLGVRVAKDDLMVGSYPPKSEPHVYRSPPHEAPSGLMARGAYTMKSRFTDDDRNDFLSWEWAIKIKDSWKD